MSLMCLRNLFAASLAALMIGVIPLVILSRIADRFLTPRRAELEPRLVEVLENPASRGMSLERFNVATEDGLQLSAMIASPIRHPGPAERGHRLRALIESPLPWGETRGTVFIVHGRGGRMEFLLPVVERFVAGGFDCVLYTARAHGDSEGDYVTYGHEETTDLRTVITSSIESGKVSGSYCIWGSSLGAAVSLQTLPDLPEMRAAILVSPFANLHEVSTYTLKRKAPKSLEGFTTLTLGLSDLFVKRRAGFGIREIRPVEQARLIEIPTMVVHGALDEVIPIAQGAAVFDALAGPKTWREVADGYHGNLLARGGDELYAEMVDYFVQAVSQ